MEPKPEERISWFPVPRESELPENLRGLFSKARQKPGFVPNVFRVYSFRPERLSAWFSHYKQLHEPTENLDAGEREMIAVAVSMANGCLYCLVAHGAALRDALGDPILGDRITLDYKRAGLNAKHTAILNFAVRLTKTPLDCLESDLEHLRSQPRACFQIANITHWRGRPSSCKKGAASEKCHQFSGNTSHQKWRTWYVYLAPAGDPYSFHCDYASGSGL
jgi:uncharacterized peroxidase-related enzyme